MFAFSQIQPRTNGFVTHDHVDLGDYLGAAWDQGVNDNFFNTVKDAAELANSNDGKVLTPEEANQQYQLPGLAFDRPVYESEAQLIYGRHLARRNTEYFLNQGATGWGRMAAGMGVGMLASATNPLDFSLMFMPAAEGAQALNIRLAGRAMETGQMTLGAFAKVAETPMNSYLASTIDVASFMTSLEAVKHMTYPAEMRHISIEESMGNILMSTAMALPIKFAADKAFAIFQHLDNKTKEVMFKQALDQVLKGRDISRLEDFAKIDENLIRESVKFDEASARGEATSVIDPQMKDIRNYIKDKYKEDIVAAAVKFADGEVRTGAAHSMIDFTGRVGESNFEDGFVTNTGRFVSREEAAQIKGARASEGEAYNHLNLENDQKMSSELTRETSDPDYLSVAQRQFFDHVKDDLGLTDAQAMRMVYEEWKKRSDDNFFKRPETQELINNERGARIKEFIEKKRVEFDPQSEFNKAARVELLRQVSEGKTVSPDDLTKYKFSPAEVDKSIASVKEDITSLKQELKDVEIPQVDKKDVDAAIRNAIDCLLEKVI